MGLCYLTAHPIFKMACFLAIFIKELKFKHTLNHIGISFAAPQESLSESITFSPQKGNRKVRPQQRRQSHTHWVQQGASREWKPWPSRSLEGKKGHSITTDDAELGLQQGGVGGACYRGGHTGPLVPPGTTSQGLSGSLWAICSFPGSLLLRAPFP